ncbi:MAG: 4'-phosphopantetheinyl transferase superfamily protein [Propionibacterium sp.]|nr:4'-phosphopantetheinyl transferase superfamily protein [Propionibacterium sp.]
MRIRGVGVDVVDVSRITRLLEHRGSFTRRWFSTAEVERCDTSEFPDREYATLLAAKEAAWKSLGLDGSGPVPWGWMTVSGDAVALSGPVAEAAGDVGRIEVTTTADARLAQAWALAWEP